MKLQRRNRMGSSAGLWRLPDLLDGQLMLVHGQPFYADSKEVYISQGWCWVVACEEKSSQSWRWLQNSGLQGQRFSTRRDALDALKAAIQLADPTATR